MNIEKVIRLKDNEEVIAVLRNHMVTRMRQILLALALVAVPFFFMLPLFSLGMPGVIGFGISISAGLIYGWREFFKWYGSAFVVTDLRVIDIDQHGWFSRTVSEVELNRIQDVSFSIKGLSGTIFGYGSVLIQTAGSGANIELSAAPDPKEAHHLITEIMAAHRAGAVAAGDNGATHKVSRLLEDAAQLDGPEARAFLTAIQQAVGKTEEREKPDLSWFGKSEEGGDEEKGQFKH